MRRNLNLNTVTLWAMWYTKYGPTTMQGWKGCDQLPTNQTITLTDARDNNQYTVAKLLDGKCWMTQNLKINGIRVSSIDSDLVSGNFVLPSKLTSGSWNSNKTAQIYYYPSNDEYFYSWQAATAGGGTQTNVQSSSYIAPNSICPKNWRLPQKK